MRRAELPLYDAASRFILIFAADATPPPSADDADERR